MSERWMIRDAGELLSASEARAQVESRIAGGELTTWLTSSAGRILGLVSNGVRAMVVVMVSDGDPGEHAIDETLENRQVDEYMDRDTVPLEDALRLVASVVEHGTPPCDVGWCVDR